MKSRHSHRVVLFCFALAAFFAGARAAVAFPSGEASAGARAVSLQEQPATHPDPYHAQKSLDVGKFYLKKGDVDAAIERFQEAIRYKPNFAEPRRLLGEIYEKRGEKAEAVKYYKEYIAILPQASDAAKVRKRIAKLSQGLERKPSAGSGPSAESREESHRPAIVGVAFLFGAELGRV
jgi:tetratricopeptide (TPR) repeat protein